MNSSLLWLTLLHSFHLATFKGKNLFASRPNVNADQQGKYSEDNSEMDGRLGILHPFQQYFSYIRMMEG